ncbi:MAG: peptide MFS transporter [Gemmatimonas sp.]
MELPQSLGSVAASPAGGDVLGHPRGLSFLFATEMWERFSYYGMRALLVLYMANYLLRPEQAGHVVGLGGFQRALEVVFGPLDVQPLSSLIYGLYTSLVYFTPIIGGLLADRVLGQRRTVVIGAVLMAIGHFLMAVEALFLFALLALILGNGCFKPNISTQVGALYAPGDPRRDRAFSVFYVGINLGAFLAPLVCGTLGERAGWHYGFGAAGVGMLIALAVYLWGTRHLPADERYKTVPGTRAPLGRDDWNAILSLIAISVFVTFFWATYEQQGNTINLWADRNTDRSLGIFGVAWEIPTTWFQAFNPFMIFAFTPFVVALWGSQARRRREPSTPTKMALGCFGVAAGNVVMIGAALQAGTDGQASWLWLLVYFALVTWGELYVSPVGLSLVSKVAPGSLLSMMMGVWLATSFTGNFVAGWLGSFWSAMGKAEFFAMIAGVAGAAGVAILLCARPLRRHLRG